MTPDELREHARVLRTLGWNEGNPNEITCDEQERACLTAADLLDREACRLETQHTHSDECWKFGPQHYKCAVREIERLTAIQHPNTASGVGSATVEVMCAQDSQYYEDLLDEHVAEIERLNAAASADRDQLRTRIAELEAVLADANQRDLIVLRAQKAELERYRDLLADEVERVTEIVRATADKIADRAVDDDRPPAVAAILAAQKEKRDDQS